ncbi:UNVERIFIED_CONTAM: hypothetical protein FKN15_007243 [Acipenser sinensis]
MGLWDRLGRTGMMQAEVMNNQPYSSPNVVSVLTVVSCSRQYEDQWVILQTPPQPVFEGDTLTLRCRVRTVDTPKPALTREPAGEISEGDTVNLSCVVEGGSGGWRYLWYKDRQGAPVYQTDSSSGTGAGYTISAAALSHSGEYWCGAGRGRNTSYSQYSHPIWVNVTGE